MQILQLKKGTVPESMVKEQLPKAQLTSLTNMGEAVNELQSGKVDAVHMDEPVALSYATKMLTWLSQQ